MKHVRRLTLLCLLVSLPSVDGIGIFLDRNVSNDDYGTVDVIADFQRLLYHEKSAFEVNAFRK